MNCTIANAFDFRSVARVARRAAASVLVLGGMLALSHEAARAAVVTTPAESQAVCSFLSDDTQATPLEIMEIFAPKAAVEGASFYVQVVNSGKDISDPQSMAVRMWFEAEKQIGPDVFMTANVPPLKSGEMAWVRFQMPALSIYHKGDLPACIRGEVMLEDKQGGKTKEFYFDVPSNKDVPGK